MSSNISYDPTLFTERKNTVAHYFVIGFKVCCRLYVYKIEKRVVKVSSLVLNELCTTH